MQFSNFNPSLYFKRLDLLLRLEKAVFSEGSPADVVLIIHYMAQGSKTCNIMIRFNEHDISGTPGNHECVFRDGPAKTIFFRNAVRIKFLAFSTSNMRFHFNLEVVPVKL